MDEYDCFGLRLRITHVLHTHFTHVCALRVALLFDVTHVTLMDRYVYAGLRYDARYDTYHTLPVVTPVVALWLLLVIGLRWLRFYRAPPLLRIALHSLPFTFVAHFTFPTRWFPTLRFPHARICLVLALLPHIYIRALPGCAPTLPLALRVTPRLRCCRYGVADFDGSRAGYARTLLCRCVARLGAVTFALDIALYLLLFLCYFTLHLRCLWSNE